MTPSDNLFQLIKSLGKSEKRFFKLYTSLRPGDKIYQRLFDAIEEQKQYDEVGIKSIFQKETFIKQLTFTKGYLYELILDSMRAYRNEKPIETQLREALSDIKFLFDKGLYLLGDRKLLKAKALA